MPYILDALIIFLAVLASELALDAYRRHRKRAHMRKLNALSHEARRRRARDVAKNRASAGGGSDSTATVS